jgi:hypothetical protein
VSTPLLFLSRRLLAPPVQALSHTLPLSACSNSVAAFKTQQTTVDEIISTERTYVDGLTLIGSVYEKPLNAAAVKHTDDNSPQHLAALFSSASQIAALHESFLADLSSEVTAHAGDDDTATAAFAKLFSHFAPYFRIYKRYLTAHAQGLSAVATLRRDSSKFEGKLAACALDERCATVGGGSSLDSLFIMPIQRVPRYVLLLEQLIKYSPEKDGDSGGSGGSGSSGGGGGGGGEATTRTQLVDALAIVKDVAAQINDSAHLRGSQAKVLQWQMRFQQLAPNVSFVAPSRVFVRAAELTTARRSDTDSGVDVVVIFNDLVVLGKRKKGEAVKLRALVPLDAYVRVQALNDDLSILTSPPSPSSPSSSSSSLSPSSSKFFALVERSGTMHVVHADTATQAAELLTVLHTTVARRVDDELLRACSGGDARRVAELLRGSRALDASVDAFTHKDEVSSTTLGAVNHYLPCFCYQTLTFYLFVSYVTRLYTRAWRPRTPMAGRASCTQRRVGMPSCCIFCGASARTRSTR